MPFLTAAACAEDDDCPVPAFPAATGTCTCDYFYGGFANIYFLPCTAVFSSANLTDVDFWQGLVDAESIGYMGKGLGSMAKKTSKTERSGSCATEDIVSITWAIKYQIKCFDLTAQTTVEKKISHLLKYKDSLLMAARFCQDADRVLPVGQFNVSDLNYTVPDNNEELVIAEVEFSWKEFGIPTSLLIAGLSAVIPKTAEGIPTGA